MVKIGINLYRCEWCGEEKNWIKETFGRPPGVDGSKGKKRWSPQLICGNCYHYISQKTIEEIHGKPNNRNPKNH